MKWALILVAVHAGLATLAAWRFIVAMGWDLTPHNFFPCLLGALVVVEVIDRTRSRAA